MLGELLVNTFSHIGLIVSHLRCFLLRNLFKECGRHVEIRSYEKIYGFKHISIGSDVVLGEYLYLTAWERIDGIDPNIIIGNNCHFGAMNHISCCNKIQIGNNLLTGKWVTIVDNNHGNSSYESLRMDPAKRIIVSKGPIIIGNNVWIGDKATILSGITIGDGAIVAANTVVTSDVPAYSIAVGNPMKIKPVKFN